VQNRRETNEASAGVRTRLQKLSRIASAHGVLAVTAALACVPVPALADRPAPQVEIETKLVVINDDFQRQLGVNQNLSNLLAGLPSIDRNSSAAPFPNPGLGPNPSGNVIGAHLFPNNSSPGTLNFSGLLTGPQYDKILDVLGRDKGTTVISVPPVITPSNQVGNVAVTDPLGRYGLQIKFVPQIDGNGTSLVMHIEPGQQTKQPVSLGAVTPGQTMIFGGYLSSPTGPISIGGTPLLGGTMRQGPDIKKDLIFFVTPRIVNVWDPSGGYQNQDPIKTDVSGTGETIGHIADLNFQNMTDGPLNFLVPPIVLESKSGKNQNYVCPFNFDVAIGSHESKTFPLNGVCVNRDKPPVGKETSGDLVVNTGDSSHPNSDCHIPANQTHDLLKYCDLKYKAVDLLQNQGAFKDFPYQDKQEQKDIAIQWSTWSDPRICDITHSPPATKDDMRKVVYHQAEGNGHVNRETKKKLDKGIDKIFETVELTSTKAKDLEEPQREVDSNTI
jgi:hypothetical protein